jgi:hypothetical protein
MSDQLVVSLTENASVAECVHFRGAGTAPLYTVAQIHQGHVDLLQSRTATASEIRRANRVLLRDDTAALLASLRAKGGDVTVLRGELLVRYPGSLSIADRLDLIRHEGGLRRLLGVA